MSVQAEVDLAVGNIPLSSQGNVGRQIIASRRVGQAAAGRPCREFHAVMHMTRCPLRHSRAIGRNRIVGADDCVADLPACKVQAVGDFDTRLGISGQPLALKKRYDMALVGVIRFKCDITQRFPNRRKGHVLIDRDRFARLILSAAGRPTIERHTRRRGKACRLCVGQFDRHIIGAADRNIIICG